jgi:BsuBI/PstI restriction endonuclease domain/BsuBI/PstI restriction endonuclease HTH domain
LTSPAERVQQAQQVLAALGFDAERANNRSALVFLALLQLGHDDPWSQATTVKLGTRVIMDWAAEHYDQAWKPNTRETIRRRTLHQFIEAGLVVQNPDDPNRPPNSPKWCYQIDDQALATSIRHDDDDLPAHVVAYLADRPGLVARYAAARALHRIPVTLPGGRRVTLSPGGQNTLIDDIINQFCALWTPGGEVLYLGDADAKWQVVERDILAEIGAVVEEHGKMPDVVVYLRDRGWLVLIEAARSHGPVDAKRHGELAALFGSSTADLVYVSAFPSRAVMRKYLVEIAWETEVWCADAPTHLIHFNGERFLGPYTASDPNAGS